MAPDTTGPTVVVTDYTFGNLDVEREILEPLGCTIVPAQCRTVAEVAAAVRDADFVLTQFAPVSAEAIQAMTKVQLIARYGIGVDNVDLIAAREHGIPVYNVPGFCIDEVADHTLGFILSLTRQITRLSVDIKAGKWGTIPPLSTFRALGDITTGVVGCGRIGRAVIERLKPFKTRILAYDPAMSAEQIAALGCEPVSLDRLFTDSDLITLHCPSTPETRNLINANSLAQMKDGVLIVNVARGSVVDQGALIAALQSGKVGGAGLDVFAVEPIEKDSPLLTMDQVIVTSHVASASVRAASTLRRSVAETVALKLRGAPVPNCVNGVTA
ncbi:MAG: dihydrofolate reductase [Chloroflexi bacterium]|nr:dihydrofolate reductase [Chloroflexota bacterium]